MTLYVMQSHVEHEMSVSFGVCYNIYFGPFNSDLRVSYCFSFMGVNPLFSVELHFCLSV